jgi:hypothetical protein
MRAHSHALMVNAQVQVAVVVAATAMIVAMAVAAATAAAEIVTACAVVASPALMAQHLRSTVCQAGMRIAALQGARASCKWTGPARTRAASASRLSILCALNNCWGKRRRHTSAHQPATQLEACCDWIHVAAMQVPLAVAPLCDGHSCSRYDKRVCRGHMLSFHMHIIMQGFVHAHHLRTPLRICIVGRQRYPSASVLRYANGTLLAVC